MSRFHSYFSLGCAVTGASRGAFDPDARQAHFAAPRAKPFQPRGFSLGRASKTVTFPASLHTFPIYIASIATIRVKVKQMPEWSVILSCAADDMNNICHNLPNYYRRKEESS